MASLSELLSTMRGQEMRAGSGDGSDVFGYRRDGVLIGIRLGSDASAPLSEVVVLPVDGCGLNPSTVHALPLGQLVASAREQITRERMASGPDLLGSPSRTNLAPFLTPRNGVRFSDQDYAGLAMAYVALVDAGERAPARVLSERYGNGSASQWSNRIGEARRRGLLTTGTRGASGGALTEKALGLLGHDPDSVE